MVCWVYWLVTTLTLLAISSTSPVKVTTTKNYYPDSYKRPVIGILAQRTYLEYKEFGNSYIGASYVKFIEMAGAQVVPIFDSSDADTLNRTLHSVNGVLFPGGAQMFPESQYFKAAKFIYEWTLDTNGNGTYFPLWGTCLGFEAILYAAAGSNLPRSDVMFECDAHRASNLTVTDGAQDSRLLKDIDSKLYQAIQVEELTYNSHNYCIDRSMIEDDKGLLHNKFNLLAVAWDSHEKEYTALVEHKKFPIYASQFHPEKNAFEWSVYFDIPHSQNAILLTQYLANFFVEEARKNRNQYPEATMFYKQNINNYFPTYTLIKRNTSIESCYFFNDERSDLDDGTEKYFVGIDF